VTEACESIQSLALGTFRAGGGRLVAILIPLGPLRVGGEHTGGVGGLRMAAMLVRDDVEAYFRNYDRESFAVFACGRDAPSEADIAEFEQQVGFALPDEFRSFAMSPLGGLYIEVREELWPRPQLYEVGPFWTFLYAVKVFGIADSTPEWLDLRVQHQQFVDEGITDLVPVLAVQGDPSRFCYNREGELILWHHDDPDVRTPVGRSFSDQLLFELAELEERLRRKRQLIGREPTQ
jgi:SMI1 / KNR4 family (SUKH-1)